MPSDGSARESQPLEFPTNIYVGPAWLHRLHGIFHRQVLIPFAIWYTRRHDPELLSHASGVLLLPFNLILKFTSKVRVEEAVAMVAADKIGLPVPKLVAYGSPSGALPGGTILMTRIPGAPLSDVFESLSDEEMASIKADLSAILARMRAYRNPAGKRISSIAGTNLIGRLIPLPKFGPCPDENSFHQIFLDIGVGCQNLWDDRNAYENTLATAQKLLSMEHETTFTHGDLLPHNIMVSDGHITGIIDWECAGWMPEYWEYTNAVKLLRPDSWWPRFVFSLPGYRYSQESECTTALGRLTDWSFTW